MSVEESAACNMNKTVEILCTYIRTYGRIDLCMWCGLLVFRHVNVPTALFLVSGLSSHRICMCHSQ